MAGEGGGIEGGVGREGEAELFVNAGELQRLLMEHHGKLGAGEGREELLAFAEAVAEKDGRGAVGEGVAAEGYDGGEDFRRGRENVARKTIRGLHDEAVGAGCSAGFGGEAGAEFEVAGVEEAAVVGVLEECLCGTVDMTGGVEGDGGVGGELFGVAEGEDVFGALAGHAGAHEAGGAGGAENLAVGREVVEVGVRHEGARRGVVGVEPPVELREVEAAGRKLDVPRHG